MLSFLFSFLSFWSISTIAFRERSSLTHEFTFYGDVKTHFLLPNQRIEMKIFENVQHYNVTVQLSGLVKKNDSFMLFPTDNPNVFKPSFDSSLRAILEMWNCKISKFEIENGILRIYLKIAFFKERMIQLDSKM